MRSRLKQLALSFAGVLMVTAQTSVPSAHAGGSLPVRALTDELDGQTYKIGGKEFDIQDARRHKTLSIRALYPLGQGPFPVVIFSHGVAGSRQGYAYLTSYWAKHGFICLQPSHADSIKLMLDQGKDSKDLLHLQNVVEDKQAWINRAGDISFLIDRLDDLLPELKGKIDRSRIGVSGHSLGAFTALILSGAQLPHPEWKPAVSSVTDRRIKAAICISSPGLKTQRSALGFTDAKQYTINVPTLFLTGDRDTYDGNSQQIPRAAFTYATGSDKYFLSINGANHMTFLGKTGGGGEQKAMMFTRSAHSFIGTPAGFVEGYGDQEEHRLLVRRATLLFWDAYLRDDLRAKKLLQTEGYSHLVGKAGQTLKK